MRSVALGLAAAVLLLSAGCTSHPGPTPPADTAHWQIAFSVTPTTPRQLDPTQFQVRVAGKDKKPVQGAAVTVQLAMSAMDMGRNQVVLGEATPGTYTGADRFTMPGDWQATVSADKGAAHQSQTFTISVQ